MLICLGLYYSGWIRYFAKGRRYPLLFAPLLGIPLPMAVGPVTYFLAASFFLRSPALCGAAVLLGIGHIYIAAADRRSCEEPSVHA